jgi:hypothetical protein
MTFEEWFQYNLTDAKPEGEIRYTKEDIRAAWVAATSAFREAMIEYVREIREG